MQATQCQFCATVMSPRKGKKFCSAGCRMASEARGRRLARRPEGVPFSCEECGTEVTRKTDTGRFPRFCSLRCTQARDRRRRAESRPAIKCAECGASFTASRANSAYCGTRCAYRAKAARAGRVPVPPAEERFWSRVAKRDSGCWEWTGAICNGYGSLRVENRHWPTHRFAWELLRGPIPVGLQIDHLCRNRRCCNPDHLEPVTQQENLRRARVAALLRGARPDDEEQR